MSSETDVSGTAVYFRFRGAGPGRPGARGYSDDYGGQEEGYDGHEDMGRGWEGGGRGRPPRVGGPPRGGGKWTCTHLFYHKLLFE